MVEIQNLTKYYGHKAALKGVSFTIKENEVLGFLGPNGAGKSTTLNIMAGVIPSTSGTVVINGYDIAQQPVKAKRCIGFLPEIPPIYPDMKVREYLHFAAGLKGIPAVKRKSEVERVMERLKITDVQKRLIRNLSKGYKQRVGFAQALLGDPPVLILDEPTNHMDIVGKEALEQMLKSYTGTVLFVSHDRYFIKEIATGILDFQADKVQYYPCTYEEYLEQKQKEAQGLIGGNKTNAAGNSGKSRNVAGEAADNRNISQVGSQSNPPTLSDVFDKKTYYNPGKIISRLKQQLVKYEKMLGESEERLAELQMQQMDTALATDYEKLTELEQAIAAEQSNQESILDRLVETETELDEMQEKTV